MLTFSKANIFKNDVLDGGNGFKIGFQSFSSNLNSTSNTKLKYLILEGSEKAPVEGCWALLAL